MECMAWHGVAWLAWHGMAQTCRVRFGWAIMACRRPTSKCRSEELTCTPADSAPKPSGALVVTASRQNQAACPTGAHRNQVLQSHERHAHQLLLLQGQRKVHAR